MINQSIKIMILNLARTEFMKRSKISITHQCEKTQHHFMVVNPDKLTNSEVNKIKKAMRVEMVFVNGKFYK